MSSPNVVVGTLTLALLASSAIVAQHVKAGMRVDPALKEEIKKKKREGTS